MDDVVVCVYIVTDTDHYDNPSSVLCSHHGHCLTGATEWEQGGPRPPLDPPFYVHPRPPPFYFGWIGALRPRNLRLNLW